MFTSRKLQDSLLLLKCCLDYWNSSCSLSSSILQWHQGESLCSGRHLPRKHLGIAFHHADGLTSIKQLIAWPIDFIQIRISLTVLFGWVLSSCSLPGWLQQRQGAWSCRNIRFWKFWGLHGKACTLIAIRAAMWCSSSKIWSCLDFINVKKGDSQSTTEASVYLWISMYEAFQVSNTRAYVGISLHLECRFSNFPKCFSTLFHWSFLHSQFLPRSGDGFNGVSTVYPSSPTNGGSGRLHTTDSGESVS